MVTAEPGAGAPSSRSVHGRSTAAAVDLRLPRIGVEEVARVFTDVEPDLQAVVEEDMARSRRAVRRD